MIPAIPWILIAHAFVLLLNSFLYCPCAAHSFSKETCSVKALLLGQSKTSYYKVLLYEHSIYPFQSGKYRLPHFKPFQSCQNQLHPFQAIPFRQKLTSPIPGHSRQAKTDFLHSSQSSQAITDFFYSKLFQLGQNQFYPVKAIPVRTKPTSSIPSHSSQAKTNCQHSMLFKSVKNQFSPF
jgi:hypothetical protein